MGKAYFPMYNSYLKRTENLTDSELGRLVRALMKYSTYGIKPDLNGRERIVFDFMAYDIDEAADNYAEMCDKNRENINKRWERENTNDTTVYDRIPTDTKDTKQKQIQKQKLKQTQTESTPPKPPKGADADGFDEFWAAYPRKVGKGDALKAWKKIKPSGELRSRISAAIEAAKGCEQWQRENGRFIPNPATWLNQERWDDDYGGPAPSSREAEMNDLVAEFMRDRGKG